jgi:hypothetical protein
MVVLAWSVEWECQVVAELSTTMIIAVRFDEKVMSDFVGSRVFNKSNVSHLGKLEYTLGRIWHPQFIKQHAGETNITTVFNLLLAS